MKYFLIVILALFAGAVGGYLGTHTQAALAATPARTTITSPWTFAATTTTANITVTSTNTATSTVDVGCVQTYATSTATPLHLAVATTSNATTTFDGVGSTSNFFAVWRYGKCPKI